ncbi:MAG: translation initiation factor IF-2 N-terminal domain-containing protein, partial [Candidatus Cloacimonadaceae bacterium]
MQIRAHELAKELKISNIALKKHLQDLGVNIRSHMSIIEAEVADMIRQKYKEQMDAEKLAERERRKIMEMRQAAKHKKTEAETPEAAPEEKPKRKTRAKAKEEAPVEATPAKTEEQADAKAAPAPAPDPEPESKTTPEPESAPAPEAPKHRIIVPYTQATPEQPRRRRERSKPKSYVESQKDKAPAAGRGRAKPEPRKPVSQDPKPLPETPMPVKEVDGKKFGKTKVTRDELGEKSKHKKAMLTGSRKTKQKLMEPTEMDEAIISRNIKKTLQKSSKRKKYHREAQSVDNVVDEIVIREFTSVSELAKIMSVAPAEIISKFLMMGQLVTMNQRLDRDSLEMICDEFKVDFRFEDEYGTDIIDREREQYHDIEAEPRPPVVTIM